MTCGAESQPQACDVLRIKASGTALLPRLGELEGVGGVVGGGGLCLIEQPLQAWFPLQVPRTLGSSEPQWEDASN